MGWLILESRWIDPLESLCQFVELNNITFIYLYFSDNMKAFPRLYIHISWEKKIEA